MLSLIGIGVAGYLFFLHLGLLRGELLGGAVCGTGAFNCHAVTAGPWGSFLGVPLSLWGILGYLTIFALSSGRPPAAIAMVRMSGPRAGAALEALTCRFAKTRAEIGRAHV